MNKHPGTSAQEPKGRIIRIERTSIHDGEGLRTVVFLKGCPLECAWCSTVESQNPFLEIGYDEHRCRQCGACVKACTQGAMKLDPRNGKALIDREKCNGCLECVRLCPARALKDYGSIMTVGEAVREIEKDEVFYFHSGGGVTISGGEPLSQAEYVRELLSECRKRGIHRALETSFFGAWNEIEPILSLINTLYVDLKHPDPDKHRVLVGVDNRVILDNLRKADLSRENFNFILRIPVIPGVNDSNEVLSESAELVSTLKNLTEVELLAYHRLGVETYRYLGREYSLSEIKSPSHEYMESKAQIFASRISREKIKINGSFL